MLGSRLVATGIHALALGPAGAVASACAAMTALALGFNRLVLRRLAGRPLISLIMVTLGLGALIRGAAPLAFGAVPGAIPLPIPSEPLDLHGVLIPAEKLVAATIATVGIAPVSAFFRFTRAGLALRAIADDERVAIDVHGHIAITWGMVGVISVLAGALWTFTTGGGLGVVVSPYLLLLAVLFVRPYGLFGRPKIERV
jgi:branched-chain amino acid transport system permease protein